MAPTEILAEQHFATINQLFKSNRINKKIEVGLLTSSKYQVSSIKYQTKQKSLNTKYLLLNTDINHWYTCIEQKQKFKKVGLVVIDEQHRFGVEQRALPKKIPKPTHINDDGDADSKNQLP